MTQGRDGQYFKTGGPPTVRLADLLVGLSAVADLGMGQPPGESARTSWLAVSLAHALGCGDATVSDVFYAALLQHIGCTAYSHEAAALFADEHSVKRASVETDFTRPWEIVFGYLPQITREAPPGERLRTLRSAVLHSRRLTEGYALANCETATMVAHRLGLPEGVRGGLLDIFEWWNGKGGPRRLRGDGISVVSRIVNVAAYAALFDRLGGPDAAVRAVGQRAGGYLDPEIADVFRAGAHGLLAGGGGAGGDLSDRLAAAEGAHPRQVDSAQGLEEILRTFGEAVDLKAPFLHGHSTGVARLTDGACRRLGVAEDETRQAHLAALVHDLGRTAVPNGVWEHPGRLGSDGWMQVRLHPYHTEQILCRSRPLAPLAAIAGMHHERLDGSGYHRTARAAQIPMTARVLAVADVWQALISDRPHRGRFSPARAAAELQAEVRAGRLDGDAVAAVVAAAQGTAPAGGGASERTRPGGLTDRQIDVLRLVARGLSNRAIAEQLVISPRTAEHHVQGVYARIGVSSRAAAALFAMEHGLLG